MNASALTRSVQDTVKGLRLPRRAAPGAFANRQRRLACDASTKATILSEAFGPGWPKLMGLDASEGVIGFTPFSELWTGRLAMAGFTVGIAEELLTGQPILQQIGLSDGYGNPALLGALLVCLATPTAILTAKTLTDAVSGEMSVNQFKRWSNLFGLDTENDAEVLANMKKADGLAAALALRGGESKMGQSLPLNAAPTCAWPRENVSLACEYPAPTEREIEAEASMQYMRDVEITNGRWAMIGFAAAICAEAASGAGVYEQLGWTLHVLGLFGTTNIL